MSGISIMWYDAQCQMSGINNGQLVAYLVQFSLQHGNEHFQTMALQSDQLYPKVQWLLYTL